MNGDEIRAKIEQTAEAVEPVKTSNFGPVILTMSDVEAKPVSWLWRGRFSLGRLSLLIGRPGVGKSFLTLDMAARISTGRAWPDGGKCPSGSVLLLCCEDDPSDTIKARLDAAGADASKIHLLQGIRAACPKTGEQRETVVTLADIDAIEATLQDMPDCKLIVIDPIGSYLGRRVDAHRDNDVRGVLAPVAALAEKYGPAVVIVAHSRKSAAKYADDTAMGSRAFTGIVRAAWHLLSDEEDSERRLLLSGKFNLGKPAPGWANRIESAIPGRDETGRLVWESGPVEMTADDAMAILNETTKPGPQPEKRNGAADWLKKFLADGQPKAVKEIHAEAKSAGLGGSEKTLSRALDFLGGIREKRGDSWVWQLDSSPQQPPKEKNLSSCPDESGP
jgi:putative DNA primase/helicase